MALFKISKGLKANLPSNKTEGYCYYTTDDSLFYIDYKDANGTLQRKALNAKDAETLTGASLAKILNSSDIEIPTSKAVLDALANKANASHNHDDRYYTETEIDEKIEEVKADASDKDVVVLLEAQRGIDAVKTIADDAYALAESKVSSLSDLDVTATAAELNYMSGVTSNVQEQIDSKSQVQIITWEADD